MSWLNLNQSLNSLKGQITNFASEVLSEVPVQEPEASTSSTGASSKELEEKCYNQELEIAALKRLTAELEATLQSERLNRKNGVREEESSWYWDPPPQPLHTETDMEDMYRTQIKNLQEELSTLKERDTVDTRTYNDEEVQRLRDENKNLTTNLEDLDSQHQLAMERLLSLKKELQKNFEVLRQEHEELKYNNDEYANEVKMLVAKIAEKDKELESLKAAKSDYDTLHHKYMNLERIHDLLRENAEKFQEENQELHEEVFKLQEQVTKLEHEVELVAKHAELSETVPRDRYDELLKELNEMKNSRNSNHDHVDEVNIDDNAKSVIENLKRELHDLRHKLAQKDSDSQTDSKAVKAEKIMQFYNKYVNFDLPVDYLEEVPSSGENVVLFKLESVFKTVNSFKKEIDTLEHKLSEKKLNISHLRTQIDDLTTENDFLTNDLHHFERELEEMKKNNDFLISEIAALKNTSKLEPIIETHEDNLAKLETELADCNKLNKNFESEIQLIQKTLSEVNNEKVLLQTSLADLKEKYTMMLSELDMFKTQTKAAEDLENTANIGSEEMVKKCTHEIHELKKQLTAAHTKNEQLSIDVHILENDKVLLTHDIDNLKQNLSLKHEIQPSAIVEQKVADDKIRETAGDNFESPHSKDVVEPLLEKNIAQKTMILTSELQKIKSEKEVIAAQLDAAVNENALLKQSVKALNTAIDNTRQQEQDLLSQIDDLKNARPAVVNNELMLQGTIQELNEKIVNQENLTVQLGKLKEINDNLTQGKLELEMELSATDRKIAYLEEEIENVISNVAEKDKLIDILNSTIKENNTKIINLNKHIKELENTLTHKDNEIRNLQKSLAEVNQELNQTQSNLSAISLEKETLSQQLKQLLIEVENKTGQITILNNSVAELDRNCSQLKSLADEKDKEIKELRQSMVEITDKLKNVNHSASADDYTILLKDKEVIENQVTDLQNNITAKQAELNQIKEEYKKLERTCVEYKNILDSTTAEKTELINLVNLKHNESLQYHNEIQRLNHVIVEQNNELKKMIDEKNVLTHSNEGCPVCEQLRMTLREKDEIIKTLNQNSSIFEKTKADLLNANKSLSMLTEKCEGLEKNIQIQLEAVKKLTAEKIQLSEQYENSTRELERLRHHLVELEENYTQELMTSEQKLTECQVRLQHVEERAKQSSTVYTSNSIRANQEVETLRNQIRLLERQREEVQARLSEADDARSRSEAALANLQLVLEQFQLDKERDINTATEKIRNKMEDLKKENSCLQKEIEKLNAKLQESLAGLQAATRLGDQLETKTAQINDLKEQVRALQTSVGAAEERYYSAVSNQQDKVDKNLVKNLVLNYVLTAGNATNKTQVLRVMSTVLDFNQQECRRLGLEKSPPGDSLAAEFVKFLQDESKPRAPLPSMMGLTRSTTPSSRKSSTIGPSPVPSESGRREPSAGAGNLLLLHADVETSSQLSQLSAEHDFRSSMTTGVNQTRDTEGAILKHVLKDMP